MLDSLPDAARVWLFSLNGTPDAATATLDAVRAWLPSWQSHGRPVQAEAALLDGPTLAVGALISPEELNAGVSGCGIDAMRRTVEQAAAPSGASLLSALQLRYREADGAWQTVARPAFRRLAREGSVDAETPVIDITLETVGALRRDGVVRAAGAAWTGRAFGLAEAG